MEGETWANDEPNENALRALRVVLLEHAHAIALACGAAREGEMVLAVVHPDGSWGGAAPYPARRAGTMGEFVDGLGFWFPPRCDTRAAVEALVELHLGNGTGH